MKVAIIQSSYLPWKGYFDVINMVDEFVLYDTVQFTKRDWRNRNKIKTPTGIKWLTIPVETKGKFNQKIKDTKVSNNFWSVSHWKTLEQNYTSAKYFSLYEKLFFSIFKNLEKEIYLSKINFTLIHEINNLLGIKTKISFAPDINCEDKTEKLIKICKLKNATEYISGPQAKEYLDETMFNKQGIKVTWMNYSGYPEYTQLYPPFDHRVSILDLIFNTGTQATKYMKTF